MTEHLAFNTLLNSSFSINQSLEILIFTIIEKIQKLACEYFKHLGRSLIIYASKGRENLAKGLKGPTVRLLIIILPTPPPIFFTRNKVFCEHIGSLSRFQGTLLQLIENILITIILKKYRTSLWKIFGFLNGFQLKNLQFSES